MAKDDNSPRANEKTMTTKKIVNENTSRNIFPNANCNGPTVGCRTKNLDSLRMERQLAVDNKISPTNSGSQGDKYSRRIIRLVFWFIRREQYPQHANVPRNKMHVINSSQFQPLLKKLEGWRVQFRANVTI